jgi:hypothetical protein
METQNAALNTVPTKSTVQLMEPHDYQYEYVECWMEMMLLLRLQPVPKRFVKYPRFKSQGIGRADIPSYKGTGERHGECFPFSRILLGLLTD